MKHIQVRYGELTLKGNNRNFFISKLIQNIKFKLKPFKEKIIFIKSHNSLKIDITDDLLLNIVLENLQDVFGIYSLSVVEEVENDLDAIANLALRIAQDSPSGTFKLEVERKDKTFPFSSQEIKQTVAKKILQNTEHLKVDVHQPLTKIEIIVKKESTQIFTSRIAALKGLPVGVSGKGLSLLSGGIDSPVASFLTMKRGMQVDFLHFMTPPHTTPEALEKVFSLVKKIARFNQNTFSLYVCDFGLLLQELMHIKDESYRITLMRRMFIRIANLLSHEIKAKAIITGESLGQVASQTIESINVINSVSQLPIIRPVITFDKEEIIEVSKKINTYEVSILPFDDVCSMYVPKNPVTKPRIHRAQEQEEQIIWEELVQHTLKNLITHYIVRDGQIIEKGKETE
ncbi:thiamine biosynthesis protein ThiI [Spiroplasma sabaudiense Ar-1343]|uniref:Probable tRNA sulfurtransferase n=1 Tax=Spiroplasma sabaudiense Ar-1343 TaxID=1276257 RepID=W6AAQ1_9MOLU|nr:tRNA uracil 4-sulfurtransferase ThiI [Spiroplasma sabaudiense]AHI54091.1 thiamine biosynthesis protein ThiI [Spiroplasma sabaudiense Ar-1343]